MLRKCAGCKNGTLIPMDAGRRPGPLQKLLPARKPHLLHKALVSKPRCLTKIKPQGVMIDKGMFYISLP